MSLIFTETQKIIADLLRRKKSLSRAGLSELIGITPASISVQTRGMIDAGYLREGPKLRANNRGTPAVSLELVGEAALTVGLSVSPNHITMVLMDLSGETLAEYRQENTFPSVHEAIGFVVAKIIELAGSTGCSMDKMTGIGLALPGNFTSDQTLVLSRSMEPWRGVDIVEYLSKEFGIPIRTHNDATSAAFCENLLGNPEGYRNFFYCYLGKGLGGAPILKGEVYTGRHGNAGTLGALMKWGGARPTYQDLLDFLAGLERYPKSSEDVNALFAEEPELFEPWLERATLQLADLLFLVTTFYDPEGIVLGGSMPSGMLEAFAKRVDFGLLKGTTRGVLPQPPITVSGYSGNYASARGAAVLALP